MLATREPSVHNRINTGAAALNRQALHRANVFAIALCGGPGCGKTTLLHETVRRLSEDFRVGVIVGNIRSERNAERLRDCDAQVEHIETIDLTAPLVREALDRIDLSTLDLVLIERGSASPPSPHDRGQSATVGVFSVAGGDEQVHKHPERIVDSDLVLLTKTDLLPFVTFNDAAFCSSAKALHPTVKVVGVSARSNAGMDQWVQWIHEMTRKHQESAAKPAATLGADYFFG